MRIKSVLIKGFKRFHQFGISNVPETARLVVMIGPNGCGKSSVFDAFATWYGHHRDWGNFDLTYHTKSGLTPAPWNQCTNIEFHSPVPRDPVERKKMFYIRSAYRNEAEFTVNSFGRPGPLLDDGRMVRRLIDNDVHVSDNYQRLIASTIMAVFNTSFANRSVRDVRDELIGHIRQSMLRVFDGLVLSGPGNPFEDQGSFYFEVTVQPVGNSFGAGSPSR